MEFKFEEGQRVIVPGFKSANGDALQGIVISRTSYLDKTMQPLIGIRWLSDDARITSGLFDQDTIERVQPGFVAQVAMTNERDLSRSGLLPTLEKPKRKRPKRKSKLKRKRNRTRSRSRR